MSGQFTKRGLLPILALVAVAACGPIRPDATGEPVPTRALATTTAEALPSSAPTSTPVSESATVPAPQIVPPAGSPPKSLGIPLAGGEAAGVFHSTAWKYVFSSDSSGFGFPRFYAKQMEEDLSVTVETIDWARGNQSSALLLSNIRLIPEMRREVSEAQVITYYGNPTTHIGWRTVLNEGDYDCSPQAVAGYRAELESIISEILTLRKGKPTIIRAFLPYVPVFKKWKAWGTYDEYHRCIEVLNAAIIQTAEGHGIPVADIFSVFNGRNHDEDPNDKGLIADGLHPTEAGDKLMADIFRQLGYTYIIP